MKKQFSLVVLSLVLLVSQSYGAEQEAKEEKKAQPCVKIGLGNEILESFKGTVARFEEDLGKILTLDSLEYRKVGSLEGPTVFLPSLKGEGVDAINLASVVMNVIRNGGLPVPQMSITKNLSLYGGREHMVGFVSQSDYIPAVQQAVIEHASRQGNTWEVNRTLDSNNIPLTIGGIASKSSIVSTWVEDEDLKAYEALKQNIESLFSRSGEKFTVPVTELVVHDAAKEILCTIRVPQPK